jgi:hypothetical protein
MSEIRVEYKGLVYGPIDLTDADGGTVYIEHKSVAGMRTIVTLEVRDDGGLDIREGITPDDGHSTLLGSINRYGMKLEGKTE